MSGTLARPTTGPDPMTQTHALATGRAVRCDYAACDAPATSRHDAWAFCAQHAEHHVAIRDDLEPPYGEKTPDGLTPQDLPEGCGTDAGAQMHRRNGEPLCAPCRDAANEAQRRRVAARNQPKPAAPTPQVGDIRELSTRVLTEHPANVRSDLGDLTDMEASVRAQGILQPLLVTRGDRGTYVVIAGHRRLAAALRAGLPRVPVVLRDNLTGTAAVEAMLVENLQRADLDPLDEARAYQELINTGRTRAQIAKAVGKTDGHLSQRLALLNLYPGEMAALRRKEITLTEAYDAGRARSPHRQPVGQRRPKPRRVPHFTITHPQAEGAASACEHETTLKLGVACGPCWERAIRDDERHKAGRA